MGERISPFTMTPEDAVVRGKNSIDNVVATLMNPALFPWLERYLVTGYNSDCDRQQIDVILFTDERFTEETGLDTLTVQVKSAECDVTWFQGVIGTNGKIHRAKFLHHTHRQWAATSLTFLNGQWPPDLIAADFMFQVCALCGHWRDLEDTYKFAEKFFPPDAVALMKCKSHLVSDYRGRFLDWVKLGSEELSTKPL